MGGIGIGDVLFAGVFPLIMRKAFGRRAGIVAVVITMTASTVIIALVDVGIVPFVPSMVFFAPLMVLQYAYWQRRQGSERAMWQYLQAEPVSGRVTVSS